MTVPWSQISGTATVAGQEPGLLLTKFPLVINQVLLYNCYSQIFNKMQALYAFWDTRPGRVTNTTPRADKNGHCACARACELCVLPNLSKVECETTTMAFRQRRVYLERTRQVRLRVPQHEQGCHRAAVEEPHGEAEEVDETADVSGDDVEQGEQSLAHSTPRQVRYVFENILLKSYMSLSCSL